MELGIATIGSPHQATDNNGAEGGPNADIAEAGMTISVIDAGNYFRGLLLLIRKDGKTMQREIDLLRRIGEALGLEEDFCLNAIDEILENTFIVDKPPVFSSKRLARMFIKDGVSIAMADGEFHPDEERWLRASADLNGLQPELLQQELNHDHRGTEGTVRLEIESVTVRPR